jgi:hypothetical protein
LSAIKSSLQKINNSSEDKDNNYQELEKLQKKVAECSWAVFLYHYIELIHDIEGKPFNSKRDDYSCFVDDSQEELLKQF